MAQYLTALWDYSAEGDFELSFKEGDKIKLLEKHNDDWWEGELNDEIGFFPANRTAPFQNETFIGSMHIEKKRPDVIPRHSSSNPYLQSMNQEKSNISPVAAAVGGNILVDISTGEEEEEQKQKQPIEGVEEQLQLKLQQVVLEDKVDTIKHDLPKGWSHSYDESGTVYYFNEETGESQWEKPSKTTTTIYTQKPNSDTVNDVIIDIEKLNLEALHPNWIRIQSVIQMKRENTLSSWKEYYAVLTHGFILLYKEGLNNKTKRPSSMKPISAYASIDLASCAIHPASKTDTKKKCVFVIDTQKSSKLLIQVANETLFSEWLGAIMRELISRKENPVTDDPELIKLLSSIPLKSSSTSSTSSDNKQNHTSSDLTSEKVPPPSLTRWFSRSNRNNNKQQQQQQSLPQQQQQQQQNNQIFGGPLQLDKDGNIPFIIRASVEQVEKRGLDVVGIYRLSGQVTSVNKYKNMFNTMEEKEIDLSQEPDINVITGILKLYFRELKSPLLTFEYYDWFMDAARLSDYDERMFRLKSLVQVLPLANYKCFEYLARHLQKVEANSLVNKMEASNLALIFSIGLLRSKQQDDLSSIMNTDLQSKVVETVIQHVDWFFDTDESDDDDIDTPPPPSSTSSSSSSSSSSSNSS